MQADKFRENRERFMFHRDRAEWLDLMTHEEWRELDPDTLPDELDEPYFDMAA